MATHIIKKVWSTCPRFQKLFEVFEKSGKQNLYACRNQVFLFFRLSQELQRMLKIAARPAFSTSTKSYLTTKMRYIQWCLLDLKLVKSFICADKRPGFFIKINGSIKKCDFEFFLFLLSYRIGFKLQLYVFF